jgi:polyisoprenoid-binding protein YceI
MTSPSPAPQSSSTLQSRLADGSLAGAWTLDAGRSAATLKSRSIWGLAPVNGAFKELAGSGSVTPAGEASGQIDIQAASLDTRNARRDKHLQSADFFLSETYPVITFRLDTIVPAGDGVTVTGTLTVRDQTRPVSFPAAVALTAGGEVALDATVHVDRSEFGLTWHQMGSSLKNEITIHAVFTKQ